MLIGQRHFYESSTVEVVVGSSFNAQPKAPASGIRAGAFGWALNELLSTNNARQSGAARLGKENLYSLNSQLSTLTSFSGANR